MRKAKKLTGKMYKRVGGVKGMMNAIKQAEDTILPIASLL
jgi:hypothetical protein